MLDTLGYPAELMLEEHGCAPLLMQPGLYCIVNLEKHGVERAAAWSSGTDQSI